ncbi:MAG: flagellar type III secretion system pore protein FliP [Deltaproteobacteria bacterium]|nr:flagellar type III secretion system pore protein FliP [Deltaproteobacteria bacterium]
MTRYLILVLFPILGEAPVVSVDLSGTQVSGVLKLMFILTALSFGPAIIMTMTSFTRLIIIFGLLRTSLGLQGSPPNLVLTGLALFLTFGLMSPIFNKCYQDGLKPYLEGTKTEFNALNDAFEPLKKFMLANTREKDLELFFNISGMHAENPSEVPLSVLLPAFVISEMTLAFSIGFFIAIPFLIVDLVVASVLASMSMITLPPIVISLPIKLMLFVMVDGWHLLITNVLQSYRI